MPRTPAAPREPADYRHWKSRAAALLERHGLPLGVMRERDLRKLLRCRVMVGEGSGGTDQGVKMFHRWKRFLTPLWLQLRAAVTDPNSLRSWSVVANDGIIATAGILEGFAGAGASHATLVTAATSATIAGMLSAGGSEWAEAAAEREAQLSAVEEEAADLARQPDVELAELVAYYEAKGLGPELAHEVAGQLMARDALDAQLESEHGILEVKSRAEVVRAGVGSAVAYALGAAIPLVITLAVPVGIEAWAILVAALASLTVTSIVGARTGRMNLRRTLTRTLVVGIWTMGVSYLVGKLVF